MVFVVAGAEERWMALVMEQMELEIIFLDESLLCLDHDFFRDRETAKLLLLEFNKVA